MCKTNSSIFLGYCQDAVHRLPDLMMKVFSAAGVDAYMDTKHFTARESCPPEILSEITQRTHYILLLTPASVRRGLLMHERRLRMEIEHVKQHDIRFSVVCGYGFNPSKRITRWFRVFPDDFDISHIDHLNFTSSMMELLDTLGFQVMVNSLDPFISQIELMQLRAEEALDRGLTDNYEAIGDNRASKGGEYFEEAVVIDPDYAAAYYQYAEFLYFFKQHPEMNYEQKYKKALSYYKKAIGLKPDEARYYAGEAKIYEVQNRYEDQLIDYTKAVQYASNCAWYYSFRAGVYMRLNRLADSIADYTTAIRLEPNEPDFYYARSCLYRYQDDYHHALEDMIHAIDVFPRHPPPDQWYIIRGFLYQDLGLHDEANADWKQAIECSYHKSQSYYVKARMHMQRNEFEKALITAQSALKVNPDHKGAQIILEKLNGDAS